jgi:hypothetical protein
MVLLQQGRALADAGARRRAMEQAEKTFLAVRGLSGETDAYRMNLAQVYYWLGKPREGRQLFDEVLKAKQGQTMAAIQVARLLREVGEHSAARTIVEAAYGKETDRRLKHEAAGERAVIPLDLDDQIVWLGRTDPADAQTKALLSAAQGQKAIREGKDTEAAAFLREAIAAYDRLPEEAATLNNSANACASLFRLTGDRHDFEQWVSRLEKGLTHAPGDAVLLGNTAEALLQSGLWEVVGETLDLGALRMTGGVQLLSYLCRDDAGRARLAQRVLANPKVAKARAYFERLLVLAPNDAHGYSQLCALLVFVGDRKGLKALREQLEGAELDLADQTRLAVEYYAGTKDRQYRDTATNSLARYKGVVQALRAKQGPTFATAAAALSAAGIHADELGLPTDANAILQGAEEAHAAFPSQGTYFALEEALAFRVNRELARHDPAFQKIHSRAKRSTYPVVLLAAALAGNAQRAEAARANPDFQRLVRMVTEYDGKFAERPKPWSWVLLGIVGSERTAQVAARVRADLVGELDRTITRRLSPLDASNALLLSWQQQIAGKEADGREILKQLSKQGVPLPVETK